jgi:SWI/SNF-related matrix-associated actin-dependent regulator of chromatin subfamily B protein 1
MFAEMLCDDLELNPGVFVNPISSTIRAQIEQTNSDNTNKEVFKEAHDKRVIIKLNIQVGNTNLIDQFEWDMADNKNCPEYFAKVLCQELGLAGEFYTAVAYQIRGQLALHKQNFTEALPSIQDGGSLMRDHTDIDQWAPYVETLTDHEMEKKVRDQDRNTRRMRRLQNAF